jgi:nucleoside-diphosphate kinase
MIKPDGVQRGLIGNIIGRFEAKGFKLVALKLTSPTKEHLETHYEDLKTKKFFPGLIEYMLMGPVVAMVWEGSNAVKTGRVMLGATNPADSLPGTIRGDLCIDVGRNICHGSDSVESANKEIALWFGKDEINNYKHHSEAFVYENILVEEAAPADAAAAPALPAAAATSAAKAFVPHEGEHNDYITYSGDRALGQKCPDLSTLVSVPKGHHDEFAGVGNGKPTCLVLFAKYLKYEAFDAVEAVSGYAANLGVESAGILMDFKEKDAKRFVEKNPCKCDIPLFHDPGWKAKDAFSKMEEGSLTLPSLFLFDKDGTIVWRQALSGQSGVMTLNISQFDYQIRAFAAGKPLGQHGKSPEAQVDDTVAGPVSTEDVFATQEVADAVW